GVQRLDEAFLLGLRQFAEHRANFLMRLRVKRCERFLPLLAERQKTSPRVLLRRSLSEQPMLLEPAQGTAQVACVQPQLLRQLARRRSGAVSELVENPSFG